VRDADRIRDLERKVQGLEEDVVAEKKRAHMWEAAASHHEHVGIALAAIKLIYRLFSAALSCFSSNLQVS